MSLDHVIIILDRALTDVGYREQLYNHPQQALADYALAEHEKGMLSLLGSAPYTLSLQGLADARRMVDAARSYNPTPSMSKGDPL